jgi:hypothetical protein
MGDTFVATLPHTSHYNTELERCFIRLSTQWSDPAPTFRQHTLEMICDAVEGVEIAKLETQAWFDVPSKADSPPHEIFKLNGEEVPASSKGLADFRALTAK